MNLLETEPVAVGVGTIVALVDALIIMATALDWIDLTTEQATAIVAFVTTLSLLVGGLVRSAVWSPASVRKLTTTAGEV